jgi:hypothetical protein
MGWAEGHSAFGVSYSRHFAGRVAVEGAVDVGPGKRPYALSTLVLRTVPGDFESPLTGTVGVAIATDGLPAFGRPKGLGFIIGGGGLLRIHSSMALRMDLQMVMWDNAGTGRVLMSALIGLD